MKSIKEQVGGRPLSAVTPERMGVEAAYRSQLEGMAQLQLAVGAGTSSQEAMMKRIIEVCGRPCMRRPVFMLCLMFLFV